MQTQTLKDIFHWHGAFTGAGAANSTKTDIETIGDLTLEMTDNPFSSLLRKIENLMDSDLLADKMEAFRLARNAVLDCIFDEKQTEKLMGKLDLIIDEIHTKRALGGAFTKSALHIITPEEEELAAACGPAAPAYVM